jgi:hypothetical protein
MALIGLVIEQAVNKRGPEPRLLHPRAALHGNRGGNFLRWTRTMGTFVSASFEGNENVC